MSRQILPPFIRSAHPRYVHVHSIIAGTASLNTYLVEVDDGEAIGLSRPHVLNVEVEPLSVLVGVEVKAQVQLIIPLAPGEIISLWVVSLSLSLSYTCTALPRFPLSNLDSNISVVSSGARGGVALDEDKLGPALEQVYYTNNKQ